MEKINLENWNRKEIYTHFSYGSNPFYMVTFKVDVTNLYEFVKKCHLSFYYSMIYFCTKAMNQVENFKYTIINEEIYLLDERLPSFTDMKKGSELFHIVTMPKVKDIYEFNKIAKQLNENQTCFIDYEKESHNLIYVSSLPWVNLTAITNEMDVTNPKLKDDCVPRISWGKYEQIGDKKMIHVSLEVNHRFIDGYHIGEFVKKLEKEINNC